MTPMNRFYTTALFLAAFLVFATGCDSNDPLQEAIDLSGRWAGQITHRSFPGRIEMDLVDRDGSITGQWGWRFTSGTAGGTVTGERLADGTARLRLRQESGRSDCTMIYEARARSADDLSGPYENDEDTCNTPADGTISVTRQ